MKLEADLGKAVQAPTAGAVVSGVTLRCHESNHFKLVPCPRIHGAGTERVK